MTLTKLLWCDVLIWDVKFTPGTVAKTHIHPSTHKTFIRMPQKHIWHFRILLATLYLRKLSRINFCGIDLHFTKCAWDLFPFTHLLLHRCFHFVFYVNLCISCILLIFWMYCILLILFNSLCFANLLEIIVFYSSCILSTFLLPTGIWLWGLCRMAIRLVEHPWIPFYKVSLES